MTGRPPATPHRHAWQRGELPPVRRPYTHYPHRLWCDAARRGTTPPDPFADDRH